MRYIRKYKRQTELSKDRGGQQQRCHTKYNSNITHLYLPTLSLGCVFLERMISVEFVQNPAYYEDQ